jgi:hypothetical protein
LEKFQSWGACRKKTEIDAEIKWDVIEKNSVPLDADGAVKVLSEKTGLMIIFKKAGWVPTIFITVLNQGTNKKPA